MGIVFATCDTQRALGFINKMYPDHKDLTKKDIPLLYSLISRDILRVQDPDFHQPCQIIGGNKYKDEDAEIKTAIAELMAKLDASKIVAD